MKDHEIDIIGLSEMRLDSKVTDSEVQINYYNIYRNDRNRNCGGKPLPGVWYAEKMPGD